MQLNEYQPLALRTAKIFPDLAGNLNHATLGICSEVGELQEVISEAWMQLPFNPLGICEEGGDIAWYGAYLCHAMGWQFEDMFLQPDVLSGHTALTCAVLGRNPPAMALVLGGISGDIATIVKGHLIYGKPLDSDLLKKRLAHLLSLTSLLMDIHGVNFEESCLPENIEKLRIRYPDKFSDVAAMERADKTPKIIVDELNATTH